MKSIFQTVTFLELGALDGFIIFSNSYCFEKKYDWRGVLIEGHPENQKKLRANAHLRPNAALFTTAICNYTSHGNPGEVSFSTRGGAIGTSLNHTANKYLDLWHKGHQKSINYQVSCVPLQSMLESTGVIDIDLFSLDVEGAELHVLQTINFAVTNVRVIVVELDNYDVVKDNQVRQLLKSNGFRNANETVGNIQSWCKPKMCTENEAYINTEFTIRKRQRQAEMKLNRYFHANTGVLCKHGKY